MKRILHIRFPLNTLPIQIEKTIHNAKESCGEMFAVIASLDPIEKTEVEIVYDPHLKSSIGEIAADPRFEGSLARRP